MTVSATADTRPFAPFEWLLAVRYLGARRKEGFISVIAGFSFIGILLGVATLIIVMAVMNGFHKEVFSRFLGLDGHVVVIRMDNPTYLFNDYESYGKRLEAVPGVKQAIPLVEGQVIASTPAFAHGSKVRGLTEEGMKSLPQIAKGIKAGTIDGFDTSDGIAIGRGMVRLLNVNVGDSLTLISPRGARTPFGTVPRIKAYKVAAIFEMGMSEFDRSMIFMPLAEAQRYFDKGSAVDVLDIVIDDPEQVERAVTEMRQLDIPGLRFVDWRVRNSSFFSVLQVQRNIMFVVLSIIVLVAAFNIISGLVMLVKDKGREIGILRTMGASQGAIMRVFLITGASIGVLGTLGGCVLGVLFCLRIDEIRLLVAKITNTNLFDPSVYYLTRLPADVSWQTTGVIVLMSIALSLLATLYPSWRASRLDPVEALRYE
jgi:lipoprotein-releasing system permease protein